MFSIKVLTPGLQEVEAQTETLPEAVKWASQLFPTLPSYETIRRNIAAMGGYASFLRDNKQNGVILLITPTK